MYNRLVHGNAGAHVRPPLPKTDHAAAAFAATQRRVYFGKVCDSGRQALVRGCCHRRRQKRCGGHPARHHSGQGQVRHRKSALYQRCDGFAPDSQRAGRQHPHGQPQYLRDRHHPYRLYRSYQRAFPPDARQLLFPRCAAGPVRFGTGRHAGRLQPWSPPHRPAPQGVHRHGRAGLGGVWYDPCDSAGPPRRPCVF